MKRIYWTAAAAIGAAVAGSPGAHAQTVFNWSSFVPWAHPIIPTTYQPWVDAVEKATGGKVKFRKLPKPVVGPRGTHSAIRNGQADASFMVHAYLPKQFAAYDFASLPFLGDDAVTTSIALQRTHDKFLANKGYYEGVKLVGVNTHGPGHFFLRSKHVTSPDVLKGLKIRTGGPVPRAIVLGMGGVSVRQPVTKAYELLSQGIVDGITFPWESVPSFRITRLVPYATEVPGGVYSTSIYFILNGKKYDGLPADVKKAMEPFMGEYYARLAGKGWNTMNGNGRAIAIKAGSKIAQAPAPVIAAVRKIGDMLERQYIERASKLGIDGAALLEYFRAETAKLSKK